MSGIEKIEEFFSEYADSLIIIGGQAFAYHLNYFNMNPRVTIDYDILVKENINHKFYDKLRELCEEAGFYKFGEQNILSDGKECFFKFRNPLNEDFPIMEFFCYNPTGDAYWKDTTKHYLKNINFRDGIETSIASLLIDKKLEDFLERNSSKHEGKMKFINILGLICLKIIAWCSNTERKRNGENVLEIDINKHSSDILKLLDIITVENILSDADCLLFQKEMDTFFKEFSLKLKKSKAILKDVFKYDLV